MDAHNMARLNKRLRVITQNHKLNAIKAFQEVLEVGLIGKSGNIIIAGREINRCLHAQTPIYQPL